MSPEKITRADIEKVKREHILDNLLYSPQEASVILAVSVRQIFKLVEEGQLQRANSSKNSGKTRIPARSVECYRKMICTEAG